MALVEQPCLRQQVRITCFAQLKVESTNFPVKQVVALFFNDGAGLEGCGGLRVIR